MKHVTWEGVRPSGSFGALARDLWRSRESGQASVPCGGCTACCRDPAMPIDLAEDEVGRYAEAVQDETKRSWSLRKRADGSCVYLIDDRCSIYADRPSSCRMYDCRAHLLGMPLSENRKVVNDAVMQWQHPTTPTVTDENLKLAFGLAYSVGLMVGNLNEDTATRMLPRRRAIRELLPVADQMRREMKANPERAGEIGARSVSELAA